MSLEQLKFALQRVAEGGEISAEELQRLEYSSNDQVILRVANHAWEHLQHFEDDGDIRVKDKKYEVAQRQGARRCLDEIEALERGEDPYDRGLSFVSRWMKRVGLKR